MRAARWSTLPTSQLSRQESTREVGCQLEGSSRYCKARRVSLSAPTTIGNRTVPLGLLSLGRCGNVAVAIDLRIDGTEHDHAHKSPRIGGWLVDHRHAQRDREEDQPACPAGDESPVGKENEERYGWRSEEQGLNHIYR